MKMKASQKEKTDCIFCKIVKGKIPCNKIYEDKDTLAFLDIHPINPGHTIVIPKKHVKDFYNLDDKTYLNVMKTVKKLSKTIETKIKPKKVGLIVAGWDVPHAHIHIVPMHDYHDITSKSLIEGKKSNPSIEELNKIAHKIKGE